VLFVLILAACQTPSAKVEPTPSTPAPVKHAAQSQQQQPQYEIENRYIMPEKPIEQKCARQCETHFAQCQANENNQLCEEEYHSCFRLCGGRVEQVRRCVKNCDGIEP